MTPVSASLAPASLHFLAICAGYTATGRSPLTDMGATDYRPFYTWEVASKRSGRRIIQSHAPC